MLDTDLLKKGRKKGGKREVGREKRKDEGIKDGMTYFRLEEES